MSERTSQAVSAELKIGGEILAEISALSDDGEGVAIVDGSRIIAHGLVPGDRALLRLTAKSRHRSEFFADIAGDLVRGPNYQLPPCAHAAPVRGRCGGCSCMHVAEQFLFSAKAQAAEAIAAQLGCVHIESIAAKRQLAYRNRANFVVQHKPGRVEYGAWAADSHEFVNLPQCEVLVPALQQIMLPLRQTLSRRAPLLSRLRYLSARASSSGEVLLELIHRGELGHLDAQLLRELSAIPNVAGVLESINRSEGNQIRGGYPALAAGKARIVESVGSLRFSVDTSTFLQLNLEVAGRMYNSAAQWLQPASVVWEFYGGIGIFGSVVARATGAEVWHAESNAISVEIARSEASRNKVRLYPNQIDLTQPADLQWPQPDAILLNPPRRGCDRPLLESVLAQPGARIAYMSCNPESFATDAQKLVEAGWKLEKFEVHDMMPQTSHVEVLGLFSPPVIPK